MHELKSKLSEFGGERMATLQTPRTEQSLECVRRARAEFGFGISPDRLAGIEVFCPNLPSAAGLPIVAGARLDIGTEGIHGT
jgi:hypothetical protein